MFLYTFVVVKNLGRGGLLAKSIPLNHGGVPCTMSSLGGMVAPCFPYALSVFWDSYRATSKLCTQLYVL